MLKKFLAGDWVHEGRIRAFSIVCLALSIVALAALLITSDGMRDYAGRPLGTDFSNVWSAGQMARSGRAAEAFDPKPHHAEQQAIFKDEAIPFYGWHYPPFFLIIAALLALFPYTIGWLIWMAATLPLYVYAMRSIIADKTAVLAALGFPAVFINFAHGQNGFLTAALAGGAMVLLRRSEWLAGILLGLLAYKPQFGLLIPIALAAGGYWRAFAGATATVLGLVAVSLAVFGTEVWFALFEHSSFTRKVVLEAGGTGWEKIQSVFSALRMWGVPVSMAYAAQAAVVLALACAVAWLWRSKAAFELKAAGLLTASLAATPYLLDYDLVALAPVIGFMTVLGLREGFRPYEKLVLALAWLAPMLARGLADALLFPLGILTLLTVFALVMARAAGQPEQASLANAQTAKKP
ncbi:MAG: DUF2029 domain-containing protein [Rhizobiales bacterium]|nr:DUF2029 domain-containing protein [Hyphomicrobiales bacterium]